MKIDQKAIKKLAELLEETSLNEIEVADGDEKIRVVKGGTVMASAPIAVAPSANDPMIQDPAAPAQANIGAPVGAVTSPMVGTCYLQPEPGAPSFANKGDTVSVGDTLCIIEAMKVMNPIKADKSGVIKDILVGDGQPVEFGDPLMVIE